MNPRCLLIPVAMFVCLVLTATAEAAYTITPLIDGGSSATRTPGQTFSLDFLLTSDASDTCDSAILDVGFSSPKLLLHGYTWGGSFSDSKDYEYYDFSNPTNGHFENFTMGTFGAGALLRLNMSVPADYVPLNDSIDIHVVPGTFALGLNNTIAVVAGPDAQLHVTPEPASWSLLAAGGLFATMWGWRRSVRCAKKRL